jgi:hypothetical protein
MQNPLFHRQAIIVLREELEYFAIPPKGGHAATDEHGAPNVALIELKRNAGDQLLRRRQIFTALQRNVQRENNVAEQHLIDMLCMRCVGPEMAIPRRGRRCWTHSGFNREDEWGYRAVEPQRCCITSIALVLLKTGIGHPPPGTLAGPLNPDGSRPGVSVNAAQLATAQKLLLFWRKPAVRSLPHFAASAVAERRAAQMLVGRPRAAIERSRGQGVVAPGMDARAVDRVICVVRALPPSAARYSGRFAVSL